jgi:alkanesulfonate monooxygenase SsuD/methylene tetrahydromethanopterin reductase-like flavin-dependent oxidoreductase (luciferase family)
MSAPAEVRLAVRTGSTDPEALIRLAVAAEQANADFLMLDTTDSLVLLAAVAAETDHIGVVGTLGTTFGEPYETARRFASLDHLSGGRAGWHVGPESYQAGDFRRVNKTEDGGRFVTAVQTLWDSWRDNDIAAAKASGRFLARPDAGAFEHHDGSYDIVGRFNVPLSPQRPPVVMRLTAPGGQWELANRHADVIAGSTSAIGDAKTRMSRPREEVLLLAEVTAESIVDDKVVRGMARLPGLGVCDGFLLRTDEPGPLHAFRSALERADVPVRSAYRGGTLRDNLGLHRQ